MTFQFQHIVPAIVAAIILCIAFLSVILFLLYKVNRMKRSALELKRRLRLYALTNNYFFEYDHIKQQLTTYAPGEETPEVISLSDSRREAMPDEPPADKKNASFWDVIFHFQSGVHEINHLCPDGSFHWLRITVETVFGGNGRPAFTLGKIKRIDKEREERALLQTKARTDSLTGIYNSQAFQKLVKQHLSQMKKGEHCAFLLLDIDHFKSINDTYGHMQGDASLCMLAKLLESSIRHNDIAGRFGGDEFLIYLSSMDSIVSLKKRCETICQAVRYTSAKDGCPLTISMGAVFAHAGADYDTLFHQADAALYQTKQQGRNGFTIAGENADASAAKESRHFSDDLIESLWVRDKKLETVLRAMRAIVFEFHAKTGKQYVSPFINEFLPGNYDDRPLSTVMLEDGIIHPEDLGISVAFRESCRRGETGKMTLRLLTQDGSYRLHRMILSHCPAIGDDVFVGILMDIDP